ncbi:MAG TPA: radical SAM protein, partial [Polyangia bacterium]
MHTTTRLRILLVRPRQPFQSIGLRHLMICNPIELEYVGATALDHDVRLFDGILERDLDGELRRFQPDLVATSCYINAVDEVAAIIAATRRHAPRALVVVGGVHATVIPEDFVPGGPDLLVRGDGMAAFRAVVDRLARGERDFAGIPGVVARADLEAGAPGAVPTYVHPDDLPFPARELTRRHWPSYYYVYHRPVTMMKTSFGCPYRCTFCFCWQITQGQYAFRSPGSIADELERIWASDIYIVDDDFLLHEQRLTDFCDIVRRRDIRKGYFCYGRSDFIADHPALMKDLSQAGLKAVVVGVESVHDDELDYFEKRLDPAVHERAFQVLRDAHVDIYASFILNPWWGDQQFRRLEQYILKNKLYYVILQPLMPLPGTLLWDEWRDRVFISRKHHAVWDISHLALPSRLPMWRYYGWMMRMYLRSYFSLWRLPELNLRTMPPIISREVPNVLMGGLKVLGGLATAPLHYSADERAAFRR